MTLLFSMVRVPFFVEICGEIDGSKKFREIAKCFPSQDVEILIFNGNTYKNFV